MSQHDVDVLSLFSRLTPQGFILRKKILRVLVRAGRELTVTDVTHRMLGVTEGRHYPLEAQVAEVLRWLASGLNVKEPQRRLVESRKVEPSDRRNVYRITPRGRQAWRLIKNLDKPPRRTTGWSYKGFGRNDRVFVRQNPNGNYWFDLRIELRRHPASEARAYRDRCLRVVGAEIRALVNGRIIVGSSDFDSRGFTFELNRLCYQALACGGTFEAHEIARKLERQLNASSTVTPS